MIFRDHFQHAYVTRDIDRAVEHMKEVYGIGEFIHFDTDIDVATPAGPRRLMTRAALGWVDASLVIELIQPGAGALDPYSHMLQTDALLNLHHVAMRTHDWDAMRQMVVDRGWPIVMEHKMAEGLNFLYADTRASLGHYVEYIWATPEMWAQIGGRDESASC